MLNYIFKRLVQSAIVFLLIALFSYSILFLIPGDPVYALYGANISPEQYHMYFEQLGLDKPVLIRFLNWLTGFFRGDFGYSSKYKMDVILLIKTRLSVTFYIGILSLIVTAAVGISFGVIAAVRRGKWQDTVITIMANLGSTVPLFWIGVIGVYVFSIKLGWLPSYGFTSPFKNLALSLRQTIMPVLAMALCQVSAITRLTRSNMLEIIREDYIRTVRAKGVKESQVILHHVIPNAITPVITMMGMLFRVAVAGSVAIEAIFNIPGIGQLMVNSIMARDVNPLQACIVIVSVAVLLVNLLVDIIYAVVDPRVRLQ